jgi:hypothetical protein
MHQIRFVPVALTLLLQLACASQPEKPAPFSATGSYDEIFTAMDAARERALRENKLVMYVMGADWCHDSIDFVQKTGSTEFSELIDERYVVQLLNVGDLEFLRGVITRFGEPVIYGTPTVLVVEPAGNTLLNRDTLHYWRDSASINSAETVDYFSRFAPGDSPAAVPDYSPALAQAMSRIDEFEQLQAERIYLAYADLGALLKSGAAEPPTAEFMAKWKNLAAMRAKIPEDLAMLRADAVTQDAAGANPIKLKFPSYNLYIDRQNGDA